MKVRTILFALAATAFLASCGGSEKKSTVIEKSAVTKITGTVEDTTVTEVKIRVVEPELDTTLTVVDGKFEIELPKAERSYGLILLMEKNQGKYGTYFVPDGSAIAVTQKGDDITAPSDADGPQSAYNAYYEEVRKIYESGSEDADTKLEELWFETVKANPDNGAALLAIADATYYLSPDKILEITDGLSDAIKKDELVASVIANAEAKMNTNEGKKFTDFTVEHVYGYDRSMDPQPLKQEVKFSDYVGKGTYVLVDFWSPWCGPCKREIPNIKQVYEQYKDKGLEVLSIAVWEREPQSHTIETAEMLGMDWHHINNAGSVPTDIYGIDGIPHLMLIGPDGTILKRGFHGLEGIQAALAEYIK